MLVVGDNLKELMAQHELSDHLDSYDINSVTLRLDGQIAIISAPDAAELEYGQDIPQEWVKRSAIPAAGYVLGPHKTVLACSRETIKMPPGYCGFVQTKGSLARLFVAALCCDSQVEPGFHGRVTLEICNLGGIPVRLKVRNEVAQLFIFRTSTKTSPLYNGRYQHAEGPTVSLAKR